MSRSELKKYPLEFFKSRKKASIGQIKVEIDGVEQTFPISRAEVRADDIVLDFDMSGGNPNFSHLIGIVISKTLLNRKVEFTSPGEPVYFLFQNAKQEWLAESGWIRVEWQEGSEKIAGLLGNVQSDRGDNSKLASGKFEVALA